MSSLLASQLETNRDGVLIVDPSGHVVLLNQRLADLWGVPKDVIGRLVDRELIKLVWPVLEDPEAFMSEIREIARSDRGVFTHLIPLKDGRWFERYTAPLLENGRYNGRIWYFHDATEQQRTLQGLRLASERLRRFFEVAVEGIFFHDQGKIIDANPAFAAMMGYGSREAILGLQMLDMIAPEYLKLVREEMGKAAVPPHEIRIRRKDGSTFLGEVRARNCEFLGQKLRVVSLLDVTERRRMEDQLVGLNAELEARVEQRTKLLESEVENHRETERQLFDAKERAESADRLKSAFLASMSHELRTPLNSIIGFTGLLLMGLVGPLNEEQEKQLGMVRSSSSHLLDLITDVLDISKLEAGQLEIKDETVEVRKSVEKAVQAAQSLAGKKALSLEVVFLSPVSKIRSDARRFEQVLSSLLTNAIKFTERGNIHVECRQEDGWLDLRVIDTGIGIRDEDKIKLFKPFQQLDTGTSRAHEGTGLGLSVSKRLVEKMGGSIYFESKFGKGSTFGFRIPAREEKMAA